MSYYLTKQLDCDFETAVDRATEALKSEGFGVLTEIDVKSTLKKKIDVDFRPYRILGACNPKLAHQALQTERNVGLMLPCNVIVQEAENGKSEVSAIDPVAAMGPIDNSELGSIAADVRNRLAKVMDLI